MHEKMNTPQMVEDIPNLPSHITQEEIDAQLAAQPETVLDPLKAQAMAESSKQSMDDFTDAKDVAKRMLETTGDPDRAMSFAQLGATYPSGAVTPDHGATFLYENIKKLQHDIRTKPDLERRTDTLDEAGNAEYVRELEHGRRVTARDMVEVAKTKKVEADLDADLAGKSYDVMLQELVEKARADAEVDNAKAKATNEKLEAVERLMAEIENL